MTTQRVLQPDVLFGPSHPVGVTLLGFESSGANGVMWTFAPHQTQAGYKPLDGNWHTVSSHWDLWIRFPFFCPAQLSVFFPPVIITLLIYYHILLWVGCLSVFPLGFNFSCRCLLKIQLRVFFWLIFQQFWLSMRPIIYSATTQWWHFLNINDQIS